MFNLKTHSVVIARDVTFQENIFPYSTTIPALTEETSYVNESDSSLHVEEHHFPVESLQTIEPNSNN